MKKFISLILALVLATTFGVSAFANEITPMRYDPCAYCGNPIFEKGIQYLRKPFMVTGSILEPPDLLRGALQANMISNSTAM